MKKRFSTIIMSLVIALSMGTQAIADVKHSPWADNFIAEAENYKILPDNFVNMDFTQNITREKFCELAYFTINEISRQTNVKISYIDRNSVFVDTSNEYVTALKRMGIISGKTDSIFAPNDFIKREEAAVILNNMADFIGLKKFTCDVVFTDRKDISSWAKQSINVAYAMNVMSGMGDGSFNPKGFYTIEQAVSTMIRLINNVPHKDCREKIDNSKYYMENDYLYWIEDLNGNVKFSISAIDYNGLNFYSNGEKLLAFAEAGNTTDIYDIEKGKILFGLPAVVEGTTLNKYIIVHNKDNENIFGVYDFRGKQILPIEHTWEELYNARYVTTLKD